MADELVTIRNQQEMLRQHVGSRIDRLEQVLESAHLEIERVGEGQRFVSKMLTKRSTNEER